MKIHTDHLTSTDLVDALAVTDLDMWGVRVEWTAAGSRSRHHAFNVSLVAEPGRDRNGKKRRNSGTAQFAGQKGATYDEWGYWLAELFERDPDMTATYYKSRDDFHAQTKNRYRVEVAA
jgi:hypothetical protein